MDFPFDLTKHVLAGLRSGPGAAPNMEALEYARNVHILDGRAMLPEQITPADGATFAYPHPQLSRLDRGDLRLGSSTVGFRAGRSGAFSSLTLWQAQTPASSFTLASTKPWQCVSANTLWFASDSENFLFKIPSGEGKVLCSDMAVNALGMVNRRLLLTCDGDWFSSDRWQHVMDMWRKHQPKGRFSHEGMTWDPSWIVALEPGGGADDIPYHIGLCALGVFGDDAFDYWLSFIDTFIENGDINLIPTERNAEVLAIRPFGDSGGVAVYGVDAVSVLAPDGMRYVETVEAEVGIAGRCAVAGPPGLHVSVDSQFHLLVLGPSGVRRIDYSEFLSTEDEVIVSFDSLFGEYWIADGTDAWIFSTVLTGPIDMCPSSLVRDASAGLIGYASNLGEDEYDVEIRFVETNFGTPDICRIHSILFDMSGLVDAEWKTEGRLSSDDAFISGPWTPTFNLNWSTPGLAGVLLRLSLRGTSSYDAPFRLSGVEARYLGSGSNVRRGPDPGFRRPTGR